MTAPPIAVPQTNEGYLAAMEELASMGVDYRANVPAGSELGRESIGGSDSFVKHRKANSRIKMGGQEMPDRMPLWNLRTGLMKMVPPTVAFDRRSRGTKAFPPEAFTFRDPGLPKPEPIEEGCDVCNRRRAEYGQGPRPFYDIYQLEMHKQALHPTRYAMDERRRESAERAEGSRELRDLIAGLIEALRPEITSGAITPEEAETRVRQDLGIVNPELVCEECGFEAKTAAGKTAHMRSHVNGGDNT